MDPIGMSDSKDVSRQASEPYDQLALGLSLDDSAVFENFFTCEGNALALAMALTAFWLGVFTLLQRESSLGFGNSSFRGKRRFLMG